jgi:Zn-dependent peptidase ImmA (M78 family)
MLTLTDIGKIEDMAKSQRKGNDLGEISPVGEKIFNIIESIYSSYILLYPLNTKKVAGFTRKQNNEIQIFVNTSLNLDFQIFAAAHELYHLIEFKNKEDEDDDYFVVCNDKEDINENLDDIVDINELKANYFAAAFLLPKNLIEKRFKGLKNGISNEEDIIVEILKLQYEFEVPFKTVLKRLKELGSIGDAELKRILLTEDINSKYCKMLDNNMHERLEKLESPNNRIYDSINSPKYAADAYRKALISFNKMEKILNKYKKQIIDFNIEKIETKAFDLSSLDNLTGDEADE